MWQVKETQLKETQQSQLETWERQLTGWKEESEPLETLVEDRKEIGTQVK